MKPSGLGRKAGIICFWLVLWQFISIAVHNSIILVGPAEVAGALIAQISTAEFWRTIGLTFGKISTGFLGAFLAGGFLRHSGADLDRFQKPVGLYRVSGGISHDLHQYHRRASQRGAPASGDGQGLSYVGLEEIPLHLLAGPASLSHKRCQYQSGHEL